MSEPINKRDFYNTLWNYFIQHANQRIQLINFYIILETFLFAGLFAMVKDASTEPSFTYKIIFCLISLASIFFSGIFFNLDCRTKQMIKYCESSIRIFESEYENDLGSDLMIFTKEKRFTDLHKKFKKFPKTYSVSFMALFAFFSVVGIICFIYFLGFYYTDKNILEIIITLALRFLGIKK